MAGMELRVFRHSATVSFFDADAKLRLAPAAYWRILQNAAAGHAAALSAATEELRKSGQTWMLSKMRLDVDRHPVLGDHLEVETWPSTRIKGARAYRDYVLKDAGGEVRARSSSLWVIVDLASRRPVRIPDSIVSLCIDPGYDIPPLEDGWLGLPEGDLTHTGFRACWSDADQNEHVNNVVMVRWAVDALPLDFLETHELVWVEAHYKAEVSIGEEVQVLTAREDGIIRQSIVKGDTVVALVHSGWRRSDPSPVTP